MYRTVASLLYEQYEQGTVNPAKIISHFTEEEEHREVASLFHTKLQELRTDKELEKALQETIVKVKTAALEQELDYLEPTDMEGLQRVMREKKSLQNPQKLHISID